LVDDLLDVSRVARGKVQVQLEIVEISKVIAQAVETVGPLLEQRQHQLSVSVPHSGLLVRGDPFRLAQVFANLLTNSAKYTPSGGQIWLDAHRDGERVIVAVRDNGSGIAPTMLEHIFEPFVQGERPGEATPGGLGLGLPLVRSLLKLHEGTVRAESDGPGTGSAFIVELPFCSTVGRNSSAEGDGRGESAGGKRLLVVDDNADAAEMMAEGLRVLGYDVRVAYDGPSALALARDFVPEYAVLDVGLPLMDGYELGERLREALGHSLVLVAVTGYSRERDTARAIPTAFSAHLVKPIDLGLLARTLDSAAVKSADSGRS
jgi:CheY-like chemotaxis protein